MSSGGKWSSVLCFRKVRRLKSSQSNEPDNNGSPYFQSKGASRKKKDCNVPEKREVESRSRGEAMTKGSQGPNVCETTATQTDWTGGWEQNIPFLAGSLPYWPSRLLPFLGIPPPPPSERVPSPSDDVSGDAGGGGPLSSIINPVERANSRQQQQQTSNGLNQFAASHPSVLRGMLHRDSQIYEQLDSDSEDEEECDAFEYEEIVYEISKSSKQLGVTVSSSLVPLPPPRQARSSDSQASDAAATAICHNDDRPPGQYQETPGDSLSSSAPDDGTTFGQVYVSRVLEGSLAADDAKMQLGDQILEINGIDVRNVRHSEELLKEAVAEAVILVGRVNPLHEHSECRMRARRKRLMAQQHQQQQMYTWCPSHIAPNCNNHVSLVDMDETQTSMARGSDYVTVGLPCQGLQNEGENGRLGPLPLGAHHFPAAARAPLGEITEEEAVRGPHSALDVDQTTKDHEKDSGLGKTDGDSSCTQGNYTSSTDYEHSLEKVPRESVKSPAIAAVRSDYQYDGSLYRETSMLSKELASIQLECDLLESRHWAERGNIPWTTTSKDNGGDKSGKGAKTSSPDFVRADQQHQQQNSTKGSRSQGKHRNNSDIRSSSTNKVVPSPPPTPKHYPKYRHQQPVAQSTGPSSEKQPSGGIIGARSGGGDISRNGSKRNEALSEIRPTEKKEAIKQWIRNSLPHSPPTTGKSQPKLGICKPHPRPATAEAPGNSHGKAPEIGSSPVEFSNYGIIRKDNNLIYAGDCVYTEEKATQMSDVVSHASYDSCQRYHPGSDVGTAITSYSISRVDIGPQQQQQQSFYQHHPHYSNFNSVVSAPSQPQQSPRDNNYFEQHHFAAPCSTMYTNKANLQHTIELQQELLRQTLLGQQKQRNENYITLSNSASHQMCSFPNIVSSAEGNQFTNSSPSFGIPPSPSKSVPMGVKAVSKASKCAAKAGDITGCHQQQQMQQQRQEQERNSNNLPMYQSEWKVKKRPDGSRYVTRRIVRNRMLKERALQISQERSGLTTDDDAMSELKVGRYWPRGERKKQLEQSKDRKRKEEKMRSMKMDSLREHSEEREICVQRHPAGAHSNCPVNLSTIVSQRLGHGHERHREHNGKNSSSQAHTGGQQQQILIPNSKTRQSDLLTVTTV